VIFPIEEITGICAERGVVYHTDAVQAVGKIPMNLNSSKIDILSLAGRKLHATKGIGAIYVRKGLNLFPFMIGGHQEQGRRGGAEDVNYIVGLGKAAELAMERLPEENTRVKALRDRLEAGLLKAPYSRVNGESKNLL
jgi:cysteine desulfurase